MQTLKFNGKYISSSTKEVVLENFMSLYDAVKAVLINESRDFIPDHMEIKKHTEYLTDSVSLFKKVDKLQLI
jgi:hypothetical protein